MQYGWRWSFGIELKIEHKIFLILKCTLTFLKKLNWIEKFLKFCNFFLICVSSASALRLKSVLRISFNAEMYNRTIESIFANSLLIEVKLQINQSRWFNSDHKIFRFQLCNFDCLCLQFCAFFLVKIIVDDAVESIKSNRENSGWRERQQKPT